MKYVADGLQVFEINDSREAYGNYHMLYNNITIPGTSHNPHSWSNSYDFMYTGLTPDSSYGAVFYWWLDVNKEFGYNFVDQCFYYSFEGNTYTFDYDWAPNEWHNIKLKYFWREATDEEYYGDGFVGLYCDDELIYSIDGADAYYTLEIGTGDQFWRIFGLDDAYMDNWVLGSYDFSWIGPDPFDVTGDDIFDADDIIALRYYIAGVDTSLIVPELADKNADGKINAKDLLIMRIELASRA